MKTVAQKMGVRAGTRAHFVAAPPQVLNGMGLPDLRIDAELSGGFDHLHLFVTTQDDMRRHFPPLRDHLTKSGMLWVSWPKGGRLGTDLNMRSVIAFMRRRPPASAVGLAAPLHAGALGST